MVLCKEGFRRILGHSRIPAGASGAVEGLAVADDALGGLFDSTHPAERIVGTASAVSPPSGRHAARFRPAPCGPLPRRDQRGAPRTSQVFLRAASSGTAHAVEVFFLPL